MTDYDVAVVVVTYQSSELLPGLFDSLANGLASLTWKLIVVDNASTDQPERVLGRMVPEGVFIQMGRNAGYAAGINAGVRAAGEPDAILALNPDVRLAPGCVVTLLRQLRKPGVGIAVPLLSDAHGKLIHSQRREPSIARALAETLFSTRIAGRILGLGEVITHPDAYRRDQLIDWAEGSTQLFSLAVWRACDGWNETFFLYSEETDFNLRARDRGQGVHYTPGAHATHLEGGSAGSSRLWPLLVANRVKLYGSRHGTLFTMVFWAIVVLREASRAALGDPGSQAALPVLMSRRRLWSSRGPEWVHDLSTPTKSI